MTDKNKHENLSLGADVTSELFLENKKSSGNKALCEALEKKQCVLSFGDEPDNTRYLKLPVTSLGMVV